MNLTARWIDAIEGTNALACTLEYQDRRYRRTINAADAHGVPFERADPVRKFVSWQGKRNYEGKYYMASTGQHVPFESLWERGYLMSLDRTGRAAEVASQPMWIDWTDPIEEHAPDYFVRLSDGTARLVDVRPEDRIEPSDAAKFERTGRMSRAIGWEYELFSLMPKALEANLRFLLRYRDPEWLRDVALPVPTGAASITVRDMAQRMDAVTTSGLGATYALIWKGYLTTDLTKPLSMQTRLVVGRNG